MRHPKKDHTYLQQKKLNLNNLESISKMKYEKIQL